MAAAPIPFPFQARDVILQETILESFAGGVYTAVFWFTMYLLLFRKKPQQQSQSNWMTFGIIVPLYILTIVHLALRWGVLRQAFIVDGQTADSILISFLTQPTWVLALSSICFGLNLLIADYVMVWRCWVMWSRAWQAAAVPLVLTVAGTVFCALSIAFQIDPSSSLFTGNRNKFAQPSLIYFILSFASTVISTSLIVYRIISATRDTGFNLLSPYRKIIEIVVESAALYCVVLLIYLPLLIRGEFTGDLLDGYPQALLISVAGIAPTIITARVSLGVAREQSTLRSESGFVFASAGPSVTVFSGAGDSQEGSLPGLDQEKGVGKVIPGHGTEV